MWFNQPASDDKVPSSIALKTSLAIACLGVLAFGIVPNFIMQIARTAANLFVF